MISYLKGTVKYYANGKVTLLSGNIGWLVNTGNISLENGQELELFIHTALRENEISLWGFKTMQELSMFELLLTVSGVGPRTSQTIVSEKSVKQVVLGIMTSDISKIKVSGVGNKTAEKVIIMLKDKIKDFESSLDSSDLNSAEVSSVTLNNEILEEALNGLTSLGYSYNDSKRVLVEIIQKEKVNSSTDLVKLALKKL